MPSWSTNCIILSNSVNQATKLAITDTKLYVSVLNLSTQDDTKLLQQLKFEFKGAINCSKYQSKVTTEAQNQYLDYLIDSSF